VNPIQTFTLDGSSHVVSVKDLERFASMTWAEAMLHTCTAVDALIRQGLTLDEALDRLVDTADQMQLDATASAKA